MKHRKCQYKNLHTHHHMIQNTNLRTNLRNCFRKQHYN